MHDDIRLLGERFPLDRLVAEAERLLDLARRDAPSLAPLGYGSDDLHELEKLTAHVATEGAGDRRRPERRTGRPRGIDAILDGKQVLRAGISAAVRAVQKRVPPAGEPPEESEAIAESLLRQIDGLAGRIAFDAPRLRGHLAQLVAILESPEIAPNLEAAPARALLVARIRDARRALPPVAQLKRGVQAATKADAAPVSRMKGLIYSNLKALCSAGRAHFLLAGDAARASAYSLTGLHAARRAKQDADAA